MLNESLSSKNNCKGSERFASHNNSLISQILSKTVESKGKNIDSDLLKLVSLVRAVIEQPRILLFYDDALDFGDGFGNNIATLAENMVNTTLICITKESVNLSVYDELIFLDAGKVLETGCPYDLIKDEGSFLHRYLKDVEGDVLNSLKQKAGIISSEDGNIQDSSISRSDGLLKKAETIEIESDDNQSEDIDSSLALEKSSIIKVPFMVDTQKFNKKGKKSESNLEQEERNLDCLSKNSNHKEIEPLETKTNK